MISLKFHHKSVFGYIQGDIDWALKSPEQARGVALPLERYPTVILSAAPAILSLPWDKFHVDKLHVDTHTVHKNP